MKIINAVILGCFLSLHSMSLLAWQMEIEEQDNQRRVMVSNDHDLHDKDVYLVWFDKDAGGQDAIMSWTVDNGWQRDVIMPTTIKPLNIKSFSKKAITSLERDCPAGHRCFLGLITVEPDKDPLDDKNWQSATMLPLSLAAGFDRIPGQTVLLTGTAPVTRDAFTPRPTAVQKDAPPEDDGKNNTEKPDIFRLDGNRLLYANSQAQRFQVIDISNINQPTLIATTKLAGSPLEVYALNGVYILLQVDYTERGGLTRLTVFKEIEGNTLQTVQTLTLSGSFVESRRRNEIIYAVMNEGTQVAINAIRIGKDGQLTEAGKTLMQGYSPITAIFSDHLVVANKDPEKWPATQVQVFDLSNPAEPLRPLKKLDIPGQIPSEFHMDVRHQQLRVMHGSQFRGDKSGNVLAVYSLQSDDLPLLGEVRDIAPGEQLFATRFADDKAYVVTYERTDPLWVIDLSVPTKPTILGELKVPGWSEKLFFHNDRLFGVGVHDQPEPTEPKDLRVRRLALSLFDISNPMNPTLLSRFIPLAGRVTWSYSEALNDERALLLNWSDKFAALPVNSWETNSGSHLQVVTFGNDRIEDAGSLDSPVSLRRSLEIGTGQLAALSDQALYTLLWGDGSVRIAGELELAANLSWLNQYNGDLLAGVYGNQGIIGLHRYTTTALDKPQQRWSLPRGYQTLQLDGDNAVFINTNPLAFQIVNLVTGKVLPAQTLEANAKNSTEPQPLELPQEDEKVSRIASGTSPIWYSRSHALVSQGWLYIAEERPFQDSGRLPLPRFMMPEKANFQPPQWVLRGWSLDNPQQTREYVIPGWPVGFDDSGRLLTQEYNDDGTMLNLMALEADNVRLLASRKVNCEAGSYEGGVQQFGDTVYFSCITNTGMMPVLEKLSAASDIIAPPPSGNSQTSFVRLDSMAGLAEKGRWTLDGQYYLQGASSDVVLLSKMNYYIGIRADDGIGGNECGVYRFPQDGKPTQLSTLGDNRYCPGETQTVLGDKQGWQARGFEGLEAFSW